jgi:predicted permease
MRRIAELLRQLAYRLRGERNDAEMAEEMRLHLELRAEQAQAKGLDPDAAAASARRRFGNPTLLREQGQNMWGWTYLDGWLRDIREAARTLLSTPGFTATAVVSLALGIGANTAIFSLVNALLLRSLPIEDPRELVQVTLGGKQGDLTNPIWEEIRDRQHALGEALAFCTDKFDLASRGEAELVDGMWVSGDFFRVLGVAPMRGRLVMPSDDLRGGGQDGAVAVISHRLWELRYAKNEDVIGQTIRINREPFRIVGVTPPWFTGLETDRSFSVAIPIAADAVLHKDGSWLDRRSMWWLKILGRLPTADSFVQVQDRLSALSPQIFQATLPESWDQQNQRDYLRNQITLRPAATGFSGAGGRYKTALYALLGIAGLVLLIACANIANLLLARASQRERELSMRMALGAGRARLVRRLLCESLLLGVVGAFAGLALALVGSRLLVGLIQTRENPIVVDLTPDVRVLAFTVGAALLTALIFGLAPALRATRIRLNDVLKEGARGASQSSRTAWLGKAIVAGQVAMSLALLAGSALFVSTMRNLMREELGFDPHNVLMIQTDLERADVPKEQRVETLGRMLERIRAVPGVESAAQSWRTPITGMGWNGMVTPDGYTPQGREDGMMWFNRVSDGYFQTLHTPIRLGRDFSPQDVVGSQRVIIIDEASARRYWGTANPIGKTIQVSAAGPEQMDSYEVIGVVQPAKYQSVTEGPKNFGFFPASQDQDPWGRVHFLVRTAAGGDLSAALRDAIAEVNPAASIQFAKLDVQVGESTTQQQVVATLSMVFAGLALLLAVVGLYGVTSYTAARRRGEIGIRIALGAEPASVVWLMVRDVALVLAGGLAVGWAASLGLGRLVEGLLFGVKPGDPRLLGLAALVLASVSGLAAYVPARRASRMQPIAVLREE